MLSKKSFPIVLLVAVGAIALYVVAGQLDLVSKWKVASSVDDLIHGRNLEVAIKSLRETPRGPTIEALKEAIGDDEGTPWGKVNALQLLSQFKEERIVNRAIESNVSTTQRGAAYLRQGDQAVQKQAGDIALAWLKDGQAQDRHLAAMILRTTNRRDAIPDLVAVLKAEGGKPESARVIVHALGALAIFKPDNITADVMKLASDKNGDDRVRTEAFRVLTQLDDAPRDELRALLLLVARDKETKNYIRHSAVSLIGLKKNATEEGWKVLKEILFDEDEEDAIFQRTALRSLARSYPLDQLPAILLDRRVYTHKYFGIRTDVAAGLGNLRNQVIADEKNRRLALDVLCQLMEDNDDKDFSDNVVRQAWISYWQLTKSVIIPDKYAASRALFMKVPPIFGEEDTLRTYLFSISHGNPQVSEAQVRALDFCTLSPEDGRMRKNDAAEYKRRKDAKLEIAREIATGMRNQIDGAIARWKADAAKEDEPAKKPDEENKDKGG
jgi:hypothetical protein